MGVFTGGTEKIADSTVDLNTLFFGRTIKKSDPMPGTSAGAARNPWIRNLKASYQRPVTSTPDISSVAMAHSFLGSGAVTSDAHGRNVASCNVSSGYGGVLPGFQATK